MKKLALILIIPIIIIMSASAFPYAKTMDGKIGTGYASDPEKFGWQLNFAWLADLDPFFALGFEPGFYWATWEKKVSSVEVGEVGANVKADSDAYIIPVLADAQIRFPNLQSRLHVIPYLTLGLGYSFMILHYATPEYDDSGGQHHDSDTQTKFFHGFTWQLMLGMAYDPGQSSKIKFIAEVGYRGAKLSKGNLEIDMSGVVLNIGVKYPLGESEPAKSI
ncbi:MAG: outer membrane beta-barrel protein [Spirochaetota bacterium]